MPKFPEGAISSQEELLKFCKEKQSVHFYLVEDSGELKKRILKEPWIKKVERPLEENDMSLVDFTIEGQSTGRLLKAIGLQESKRKDHPSSFIFFNYWNAFAYSIQQIQQRQKQRLASDTKQAV